MKSKLHLVGLIATVLAAPARADRGSSEAGPGNSADVDGSAPPFGGAAGRGSRAVGGSAPPFGGAAGRGSRAVDGDDAGDVDDDGRHVAVAAGWAALELAIPAWYYWRTQNEQEVDWTRPSWKDKLTLHSVRFDTNPFHVNAIRHPLTGVGDYQIARSNGFSPLESTLFTYLAGAIWEFCVEYREDPAINDLIMNGAGGLAIGEPLYQIGQLWRGGELSLTDRIRTAAFSPFAATQDLWRSHRTRQRRRAWSDFAVTAGAVSHRLENGATRGELAIGLDIDVVRDRAFVAGGDHDGRIATGAWSRVALGARLGNAGAGADAVETSFRSRTSIAGSYTQDDAGDGRLLALGAAFTYRRERLGQGGDHVAIAHLLGPQLQLSRRTAAGELRWDIAGYVDFGLIDAHVFSPISPLPPPPPYLSTLQVAGYYDGGGATLETRVRGDRGPWHAELELTGHQLWSLDFADRVQQVADVSRAAEPASAVAIPPTPHGVADLRLYGHAQIGVRSGLWGLAATVDAAYRRGTWADLERATHDWSIGLLATGNL